MADNWTDVPGYMKTETWPSGLGGTIYLYLQYDADYYNAEWLRVRWRIGCGSNKLSGGNSWNHYFLLINPNNTAGYWTNRYLYPIKTTWTKGRSASYPYDGGEYWLKKSSTATSFSIPEVWLCNDGYDNTSDNADSFYDAYKVGGSRGSSLYRHYAVDTVSGLSNVIAGPNTTGSYVTITDNYNNTFSITGTLGSAGTNNSYKYTECFLWWTQAKANASTWQWYSSSDKNGNIYTFADNTTSKSVDGLAVNITDNGAADKQVYARVTTASTYGTAVDKYSSVTNIRQYCAPTPATERPTLTYSKSRLTVRENWTFSWHEGTPANDSSPIKGYEIRITKNKVEIPNLTISSNGVITKGTSGGSTYLYWTNTSSLQVTCNPENLGFAAKDKVVFWVRPYTRYGKNYDGDLLPSGWPAHTATVEATVQNAAVVNKYDNASSKWQEGIACVYKNGSWVEADSVLVYKNGNWVEST